MKILKSDFSFKSSNGINTIRGVKICKAEGPYVGLLQISHGMVEHYDRYIDFMEFMAQAGFVVYMHDHLGHKHSVDSDDQLGYFAPENGHIHVLNDLLHTAKMAKEENPGLKLILLGHSMGSFYARVFGAVHSDAIDGLIISGTGGPNKAAPMGLAAVKAMIKIKGDKHRSDKINNMMFGAYLDRIENPKTKSDWITRDEEIVRQYVADKYCQFVFTLSGFKDLMEILTLSNNADTFANTPKEMPMYIFSGSMDPVGGYGMGVMQVVDEYKKAGCTDVSVNIYDGGRHEMLNEINRDRVYEDVKNWSLSKVEE